MLKGQWLFKQEIRNGVPIIHLPETLFLKTEAPMQNRRLSMLTEVSLRPHYESAGGTPDKKTFYVSGSDPADGSSAVISGRRITMESRVFSNSAVMLPPICSMTVFAIARPRPVECCADSTV